MIASRITLGGWEFFSMLLYHGSNMEVVEPRLVEQTRGLDFGAGFYLTTNEAQAARFSEIVAKRKKCGVATVSVYEFDMGTAEGTLAIRRFKFADAEWLRFVAQNRLKIHQGDIHDIVVGPVANDTVMPTIQTYLAGFITEEATLATLKTSKLADQVCIKSDRALSLMRFVNSFETKRGGAHGGDKHG
jgi:hypothetical protein